MKKSLSILEVVLIMTPLNPAMVLGARHNDARSSRRMEWHRLFVTYEFSKNETQKKVLRRF